LQKKDNSLQLGQSEADKRLNKVKPSESDGRNVITFVLIGLFGLVGLIGVVVAKKS
jgi:hypothetical protein